MTTEVPRIKKVTIESEISQCYDCPFLLAWQIGRGLMRFRFTCVKTLKDIRSSSKIDEDCPLAEGEG